MEAFAVSTEVDGLRTLLQEAVELLKLQEEVTATLGPSRENAQIAANEKRRKFLRKIGAHVALGTDARMR